MNTFIEVYMNWYYYFIIFKLLHPDLEKTKLGELLFDLLFLSIK